MVSQQLRIRRSSHLRAHRSELLAFKTTDSSRTFRIWRDTYRANDFPPTPFSPICSRHSWGLLSFSLFAFRSRANGVLGCRARITAPSRIVQMIQPVAQQAAHVAAQPTTALYSQEILILRPSGSDIS